MKKKSWLKNTCGSSIHSDLWLPAYVDALSKNLGSGQCTNMNKNYKGEQYELLRKKGVYPCEWTNLERLSDDELPRKKLCVPN